MGCCVFCGLGVLWIVCRVVAVLCAVLSVVCALCCACVCAVCAVCCVPCANKQTNRIRRRATKVVSITGENPNSRFRIGVSGGGGPLSTFISVLISVKVCGESVCSCQFAPRSMGKRGRLRSEASLRPHTHHLPTPTHQNDSKATQT